MVINYLFIFLAGLLLSLVSTFLLKRQVPVKKFLAPRGIPLSGGIGIGISFIFVCLLGSYLYGFAGRQIAGIIIASSIILIAGIIDDIFELSIAAKFLVQLVAVAILIFFGIKTQIVYIGNILNAVVTLVWILAITNAFNHLDVMDGVAAVSALVVSLAFVVISLLNGDPRSLVLFLALCGAIAGFLVYNLPPAKVYMGNSGSHFLGFVLSAAALIISYAPLERSVALLSPVLILGFPIFDSVFLILMRIRQGRSIFKKSEDHIPLRLLKMGYSKNKALLIVSILALLFSIGGILVSRASNLRGIIIIVLLTLASLFILIKAGKVAVDG